MTGVIAEFVSELPARVRAIEDGRRRGDTALVRRISHQLKGVASGYGFATIGEAASRVEALLNPNGGPEPDVGRAAGQIDSLLDQCVCAASEMHPVDAAPESDDTSRNDGCMHG